MFLSKIFWTAALTLVLAACGGGGGGSPSVIPITPSTPSVPVTTTPVVNTPTLTLAQTLGQQIASIRSGVGAPVPTHDARLDTSASNHANCVIAKWYAGGGHLDPASNGANASGQTLVYLEDPATPCFTGATVTDRARAAGYLGTVVGEDIVPSSFANAKACVDTIVGTVFHRSRLTGPSSNDVGVGIAYGADQQIAVCVLDSGFVGTAPVLPATWVGVYPYDGQTNVSLVASLESPDSAPEAATKGFPVSLQVRDGGKLAVTSFTLTTAAGASVPVKIVTKTSFPNYLTDSQAFIVPLVPLTSNTSYTVRFVGTNDSTALSKSWTFTTGAQ